VFSIGQGVWLKEQQHTSRTIRQLPHVVAATLIVGIGPIAVIWALRRNGVINSPALAIVLGTVLPSVCPTSAR
jgi:MFS superfamily sulfate permease-like transporter